MLKHVLKDHKQSYQIDFYESNQIYILVHSVHAFSKFELLNKDYD